MIELDRHIEILLLSNDCVIIPNFGGFMAHYVEARKDERDNAFLPPMRTIGFNPKLTLNDSLLAQSYVEVYDISYPDAIARIEDEVRELRQRLEHDEEYELNDIGTLRLNDNGNLEFEPCDAGILTPALYGLSYYNIKTIEQIEQEVAEGEAKKLAAQLVDIKTEVVSTSCVAEEQLDDNDTPSAHGVQTTALWRNIAVACAAVIVFLLLPSKLGNNKSHVIESKINTQLLDYVMPKDYTQGEQNVREVVESTSHRSEVADAPKGKQEVERQPQTAHAEGGYTIVLASKITKKNAAAYAADLQRRGYKDAEVRTSNRNNQVVYGNYTTQKEASQAMNELRQEKEFVEAWIMKY